MGCHCYMCRKFKGYKSNKGIGKCKKYKTAITDKLDGCINGEVKN